MKQKFALLLSVCLLAAALTACGKDTNQTANDNGTSSGSTAANDRTENNSTPPTTAQDTMEKPASPETGTKDPLTGTDGTTANSDTSTTQNGQNDGNLLDDVEDGLETDIDRMMRDGQLGADHERTTNGTTAPDTAAR